MNEFKPTIKVTNNVPHLDETFENLSKLYEKVSSPCRIDNPEVFELLTEIINKTVAGLLRQLKPVSREEYLKAVESEKAQRLYYAVNELAKKTGRVASPYEVECLRKMIYEGKLPASDFVDNLKTIKSALEKL